MNKMNTLSVFLLVLTTIIWGSAFIFQDIGMEFVEPFTFNVFRCLSCTIFLIIVSFVVTLINKKQNKIKQYKNKDLVIGSIVVGLFTTVAISTQQIGISYEGAGRSGFITSLYIIFVPLIGMFFGRKVHPFILISIIFSLTGLYLININGGEVTLNFGTICLLLCAIFYAFQIVAISYFTPKCDSIKLTAGQFLVAGILEIPFMFIFETPVLNDIIQALVPILYCGILSSGVAFTLQVYTQKYLHETVASMIMALESVFAIIFAIIILKEKYSYIELIGCVLIFISVIITQIPFNKLFKKKN